MSWHDDLIQLKDERPYYDVSRVRRGLPGYVLWIDVLGTKAAMESSMPRAQNFVMKLHIAFLEARRGGGPHYFPMNDGAFVVYRTWDPVASLTTSALRRLAILFALEENQCHRFMVRGAVAHGDCLFGSVMAGQNRRLESADAKRFSSRIILGEPLARAYRSEDKAPPFGVFVDESAAVPGGPTTRDGLWPWFDRAEVEPAVREGLRDRLNQHLSQANYDKADKHRRAADAMLRSSRANVARPTKS